MLDALSALQSADYTDFSPELLQPVVAGTARSYALSDAQSDDAPASASDDADADTTDADTLSAPRPNGEAEESPYAILARDETESAINYSGASVPEGEWLEAESLLCCKTGALLGYAFKIEEWSDADKRQALIAPSHGTSAEWLHDDARALDALQESDREGYACYTLALLSRLYRKQQRIYSHNDGPESASSLWTLARARLWLNLTTDDRLRELNETLCRCLTVAPSVLIQLPRQFKLSALACNPAFPDALAASAQNGELQPVLAKCYNRALAACETAARELRPRRKGMGEIVPRTPLEAAQGPGNVRGQRKSRKALEQAQLFAGLFRQFGMTLEDAISGKPRQTPAASFTRFLTQAPPSQEPQEPLELPADQGEPGLDDYSALIDAFGEIEVSEAEARAADALDHSFDDEDALEDVLSFMEAPQRGGTRQRPEDDDDAVEIRTIKRPIATLPQIAQVITQASVLQEIAQAPSAPANKFAKWITP